MLHVPNTYCINIYHDFFFFLENKILIFIYNVLNKDNKHIFLSTQRSVYQGTQLMMMSIIIFKIFKIAYQKNTYKTHFFSVLSPQLNPVKRSKVDRKIFTDRKASCKREKQKINIFLFGSGSLSTCICNNVHVTYIIK